MIRRPSHYGLGGGFEAHYICLQCMNKVTVGGRYTRRTLAVSDVAGPATTPSQPIPGGREVSVPGMPATR